MSDSPRAERAARHAPKTGCFDKPVWTIPSLAQALGSLPHHLLAVAPTLFGRPIDGRLREKLMLAVATANRCWYCQLAHTELGEASGLDPEEIGALLDGEDGNSTAAERAALGYVRDLARRGFRSRDEGLHAGLAAHYDAAAIAAIESTAHVMNFANRFGNSFDAARTRLRGGCDASRASLGDLALVSALFLPAAACMAPVVGLLRLRRQTRRRGGTSRQAAP